VIVLVNDTAQCAGLLPSAAAHAVSGRAVHIVVRSPAHGGGERWQVATEAELFDLLVHARHRYPQVPMTAQVASFEDPAVRRQLAEAEFVLLGATPGAAAGRAQGQSSWRHRLSQIATTTAVLPVPG
jgi:hypothetical protein